VGEEAVLLPTHASRCPQSGKGYHATSQRARRVAIGSLMLLMSCALVGTLSHVSAGARYYGMQAAHKQAAATQQLYEYYEQLLDQTAEHPEEKPAVRMADPLQITQLDEEGEMDPQPANAKESELKPTATQELASAKVEPETQELEEDNSARENTLQAEITRLSAEEELSSEPQQQQLVAVGEEDEDEKKLAIHHQSLKVLQQMLEQTKEAEKKTKHRLMIKAIAKEVMTQIHSLQQKQPKALEARSKDTEQLYQTNEAQRSDLEEEIAQLSKPSTQDLYQQNHQAELSLQDEISQLSKPQEQELLELQPEDDAAVHTQALGMLKELIGKAKEDVLADQPTDEQDSRVLKTADGVQFQTLAEDDDEDIVPRTQLAAVTKAAAAAAATVAAAAPPPVAAPVVAAPVSVSSTGGAGAQAEDALAKKVAEELQPSIGAKLTAQIMQQVEKSIEANEAKLETQIKSAAVNAAKSAIDADAPAASPVADTTPEMQVTTTVSHGKDGVTKTIVTKHYTKQAPTAAVVKKEAEVKKELEDPAVDAEIKALEEIAVKKHNIDTALLAKEKSVIAKARASTAGAADAAADAAVSPEPAATVVSSTVGAGFAG